MRGIAWGRERGVVVASHLPFELADRPALLPLRLLGRHALGGGLDALPARLGLLPRSELLGVLGHLLLLLLLLLPVLDIELGFGLGLRPRSGLALRRRVLLHRAPPLYLRSTVSRESSSTQRLLDHISSSGAGAPQPRGGWRARAGPWFFKPRQNIQLRLLLQAR